MKGQKFRRGIVRVVVQEAGPKSTRALVANHWWRKCGRKFNYSGHIEIPTARVERILYSRFKPQGWLELRGA